MNKLYECRELRSKVNILNDRIYELQLKALAPKAQTTDDMPKVSGHSNLIESYVEKKEKLNSQRRIYITRLRKLWNEVNEDLSRLGLTTDERNLMCLRFYEGRSWKECGEFLAWNESKIFRTYRKIIKLYINSN